MRILFLNEDKGNFSKLVGWINEYTDHEAFQWRRMKDVDGVIEQCPMSEPDIVINADGKFVTYEMLEDMGIANKPWRATYISSAPKFRNGPLAYDHRIASFNSFFFGQFEIDGDYLTYNRYNPVTGEQDILTPYAPITYLPLPIDTSIFTQAELRTDKLVVGHCQSSAVSAGGYSKGFDALRTAAKDSKSEIDLIYNVSFEVAVARRADTNLIYDNDLGNIGNTGFESMAQGIPVIGRFHDCVYEQLERLSGNVPFPAIRYTDDFIAKLTGYKGDLTQLVTIGQASRDWMTTHYTPAKQANYWCDIIEHKINA